MGHEGWSSVSASHGEKCRDEIRQHEDHRLPRLELGGEAAARATCDDVGAGCAGLWTEVLSCRLPASGV